MSRRLVLLAEAHEDLREAAAWYKTQREPLAKQFRFAVTAALTLVRRHPLRFQAYWGNVHHFVMKAFPYSIFYRFDDEEVEVLAVFHERRDPSEWQRRL